MKKIVLSVLLAMLLLPVNVGGQILRDTLYKVSFSFDMVATSAGVDALLPVDMHCEAGLILSLAVDGEASNDWELYIYDYDMDGASTNQTWYSDADRDDESILVYSNDGSTFGWRDDSVFPFYCADTTETTSLYIGAYNSDAATTMTVSGDMRYKCLKNRDWGNVAE